jgi:dTMP kinase
MEMGIMKHMIRGILISVEGIDGCGKSSFIKKLAHKLEPEIPVILTKEPGGSNLGIHLRTALNERLLQGQRIEICSKSEFLLFAADRAQHTIDIIEPALKKRCIVISDRMSDSSIVYQGYARGLDIDMINRINMWATNGITPDVTFYLKIDPRIALQRIKNRDEQLTAFEQENEHFMQQVAQGYDAWFKHKAHVVTLDATQNISSMVTHALTHINHLTNTLLKTTHVS